MIFPENKDKVSLTVKVTNLEQNPDLESDTLFDPPIRQLHPEHTGYLGKLPIYELTDDISE